MIDGAASFDAERPATNLYNCLGYLPTMGFPVPSAVGALCLIVWSRGCLLLHGLSSARVEYCIYVHLSFEGLRVKIYRTKMEA